MIKVYLNDDGESIFFDGDMLVTDYVMFLILADTHQDHASL